MKKIKLQLPNIDQEPKNTVIPIINDNIKSILNEILNLYTKDIDEITEKEFKEILDKADMLIVECHNSKTFRVNKNENFSRLIYEYQRLNLKYEAYKFTKQLDFVAKEHCEIKKQQDTLKDENNNLVYNILGFIASFSVVSAAVSAINKMETISSVMVFMAFIAFILLTTLIALNNFYRNNYPKNKLQNNYFLWKMLIFVIILLIGYSGIQYIQNNLDYICENIGKGIGQTITIEKDNKE